MSHINGWIPVAEKLPDDGEAVLIALDKDDVWMGFLNGDDWRLIDGDYCGASINERVTHWMPLPEPPQQQRAEQP